MLFAASRPPFQKQRNQGRSHPRGHETPPANLRPDLSPFLFLTPNCGLPFLAFTIFSGRICFSVRVFGRSSDVRLCFGDWWRQEWLGCLGVMPDLGSLPVDMLVAGRKPPTRTRVEVRKRIGSRSSISGSGRQQDFIRFGGCTRLLLFLVPTCLIQIGDHP
jgi:hypothetical protein